MSTNSILAPQTLATMDLFLGLPPTALESVVAAARIRELATQPSERRVANAVLRLARQAGHRTADGMAIEFPLRRKDIAEISGTTLHTASRILTAWQKVGLLTSHNLRLTVLQPAELARIADGPPD